MTNESLKLDMKQPENRYALIFDYFQTHGNRAYGRNWDYADRVLKEIDTLQMKGIDLGRLSYAIAEATRMVFRKVGIPMLDDFSPLKLLRSERENARLMEVAEGERLAREREKLNSGKTQ